MTGSARSASDSNEALKELKHDPVGSVYLVLGQYMYVSFSSSASSL